LRIKIVGECDAARVLRKKLGVAGFVVSEDFPDYTVIVADSGDLEDRDPVIRVDSIPCKLETLVAYHISKLTKTDLRISRQTGEVFADNKIRIVVPLKPEDSIAVELGVLRAFLDMGRQEDNPAVPSPVTAPKLAWYKIWWNRMTGVKFFLLLVLASQAFGQGSTPTGQVPTKVDITKVGSTTVNPATGIPVQIVSGGGSGGTASNFGAAFPLTGTAAGASDGVNMQPLLVDGTGLLKINCLAGCVAGGSFSDSTPFTFGATAVGNMSAVVDDVATNTVAENSAGAVRMSPSRILYMDLSKTGANATAIKVDNSAVLQTDNITQFGGAVLVTGTGVSGAGIPRVTVASDSFPATQAISATALVDTGNSTSTPLLAGGVFTGTANNILAWPSFTIMVVSDRAGTLQVQWGDDGTNWRITISQAIAASTPEHIVLQRRAKFYRVVYTNGGVNQTNFILQAILHPVASMFTTTTLAESIDDNDTGILTKSVLIGQTTAGGGAYVAVKVNPSGTLTTDASGSTVTIQSNASMNLTQVGGSAVVTGTGVSGLGIPRVTVSSDSFPTTQQVGGTVTANAGTGTFNIQGNASVNLNQVGGTALSGANVVDVPNAAFKVNCVTGCTAGGTFTDNSAFTAGATSESNIGGVFNDGLAAVTSGNAAATRITPNRALHVNLRDNTGAELGTPANPVHIDPVGTTPQPVSGTVATTPPANASTNVTQFGGSAISTGTGASGAGIPRVTVSNDSSLTGTLADNGVVAATNRLPVLTSIYQTSYLNGVAATQARNGALSQGTDGLLWTAALPALRPASFAASSTVASAAAATDIAVMPGNAANTVLLTKITVSCTQTTAGIITLNIIKRTTADTGGTSAAMTAIQDDTNTAAASSAPLSFTANPTINSTIGNVDTYKLGCMSPSSASPNDIYILNRQQKPLVLRGTAQQIAVNLGGATVTGGSFTVSFQWIETATLTP